MPAEKVANRDGINRREGQERWQGTEGTHGLANFSNLNACAYPSISFKALQPEGMVLLTEYLVASACNFTALVIWLALSGGGIPKWEH